MNRQHLDACIRDTLDHYFRDLGETPPHGMHEMIVSAVEKPLIETVLARAGGNQSRAAQWLGINRNTLRRKLLELGIDAG